MWRSVLCLILLPSLTAAQSVQIRQAAPPASDAPQSRVAPASQPKEPSYRQYTYHDAIRRGRTEQVAIQLWPKGFVTLPNSPVTGIVPLNLELQPNEGLTLTKFRYSNTFSRKFTAYPDPITVTGLPTIQFKVHVGSDVALGTHVLTGKLTYQAIHPDSSLGLVQQLEVAVPLTVVEHNAKVRRGEWPLHHTPVGLVIAIIVLSPVLIALLPVYMICISAGKCD